MWFQILLLISLAAIAVYLLRSTPSPRHLAIRRLVVLMAILAGVVGVVAPGVLSAIANVVGVGRGSDLLFYVAIIAGLLYIVSEYKRSAQTAKTLTSLARELALTEARLTDRITQLENREEERASARSSIKDSE
jgi:hypothetical protein